MADTGTPPVDETAPVHVDTGPTPTSTDLGPSEPASPALTHSGVPDAPANAADAAAAAAAPAPSDTDRSTVDVGHGPAIGAPLVDMQDGNAAERLLHAALCGHSAARVAERLRGAFHTLPWETASETERQHATADVKAIAEGIQQSPFVQRVVERAVTLGHDALTAWAAAAAFYRAARGHLADTSEEGKQRAERVAANASVAVHDTTGTAG